MPLTQSDPGPTFNVHGNYNDYGTQYVLQKGESVTETTLRSKFVYAPPVPISPRFTGQEKYLERIRDYFSRRESHGPEKRCLLLHGKGGVGKTQIALKFAQESSSRFWRTFWVDASSSETMELSFKRIARDPEAVAVGIEASPSAVLRWLSQIEHEWLLVYDNADGDPNNIEGYIPPGTHGNVLFTSRNPNMERFVASPEASIEVDGMGEDDATLLLLKWVTPSAAESDVEIERLAKSIVKELCYLPLAVDQAGAAIKSGLCNIGDYLTMYSNHRKFLMSDPSFRGASNYGRAVYTTWDLSFIAISTALKAGSDLMTSRAAESAIFLLEIFAFLHHENISEDIFRRAAEASVKHGDSVVPLHDLVPRALIQLDRSGRWDPLFFRGGIRVLISFSLVKRSTIGSMYSLHPLVHAWSRDRMLDDESKVNVCRSASSLLAHAITSEYLAADYAFRRDLIPHIKLCTLHLAADVEPEDYTVEELSHFGSAYYENGFYEEAAQLQETWVKKCMKLFGIEDSGTLSSMHNLALTYVAQGHYTKAEELGVQILELMVFVIGDAYSDAALNSMHNLTVIYLSQGRYKEAEELVVRVIELKNKVFGEEHSGTLASMQLLVSAYSEQERHQEAEALGARVLELTKKLLGEEHPDTLGIMHNLVTTYSHLGRHKEAEELAVRVLKLRTKVLGEEHPYTLESNVNVAWAHRRQGRHKEAEELILRVLRLTKKLFGEEHPKTLRSMTDLTYTYEGQGRYKEAEELGVQVLALMKKVLGEEHPNTLRSMCDLVTTYWIQGRHKEAEELGVQVVELKKKVFGEEHPDTLRSMHGLAMTYCSQGRHKKAEELGARVLELRKKALREEHPDILGSMYLLALIYRRHGLHTEAELELLARLLESNKRVLGEEHPDTLNCMHFLAMAHCSRGHYKDAEELLVRVLKLKKQVLGEEHSNTLISLHLLASIYVRQGRIEKAEELGIRVLKLE